MFKDFKISIQGKILSAIYRIDPHLLGINNTDAWTNLGYWQAHFSYAEAAEHLATDLAESLTLSSKDHLLEIGAGYGASLNLWHQKFVVDNVSVLELQALCCQHIRQKKLPYVKNVFHQSIFDAKPSDISTTFDAILSVDATYHYSLVHYLQALTPWLAPKARIGFHLLLKSDNWQDDGDVEQKIAKKLAFAKVGSQQLMKHQELEDVLTQQGYAVIEIKDLTHQVFQGFSNYILDRHQKNWSWRQRWSIGGIKIHSTAQLCRYLAQTQQLRYIQVTAQRLT